MTIIAKRFTIRNSEHLSKKFGDRLNVVNMTSWLPALDTGIALGFQNIFNPILHGLGSSNITSDKSNTTFPEIVVLTPTKDRVSLVTADHRTIMSTFRVTRIPHESFVADRAMERDFLHCSISLCAKSGTKLSSFVFSLYSYLENITASWTAFVETMVCHTTNTITTNQQSQVKRDEIGEPYVQKDMAIPSQVRLQSGRCRDYWRGTAPLMTSLSVPPCTSR